MEYRGFKVILPANMREENPFVWLQRVGRYYVELGDTEVGGLIRIDNFLDSLEQHIDRLTDNLVSISARREHINLELLKNESYTEEIEELKERLEKLDKKLGVDKK